MTVLVNNQEPWLVMRGVLRDELRRRLQQAASAAGVGVAFDAPDMPRDWLVSCDDKANSAAQDRISESCSACSLHHDQRLIPFRSDHLRGCHLCLCSPDNSSTAVIQCMGDLAVAVIETCELAGREKLLLQELATSWETLETLYESSLDLQSRDQVQNVTDRLLDRAVAASPDLSALLWILEDDGFHVVGERRCPAPAVRSASLGLVGIARQRGVPLVLDDIGSEASRTGANPEMQGCGPIAVIPVRTRQGLEAALQVWKARGTAPFESPAVRLLESIALQAASAIENDRLYRAALEGERMRQEIDIGSRIQQHLLLGKHPEDLVGVEVANHMLPSRQVGGDFYHFVRHSTECFDAIVGDVMGKGIPAALMGAATKSSLLSVIAESKSNVDTDYLPQPADIVTAANRQMFPQLAQLDSFVTLFYARVDLDKKKLTYVDAGHTQTLHYVAKSGSVELLQGNGFPLGFSGAETYCQTEVELGPSDVVLAYSDGISEATNPQGLPYGVDRMIGFLRQNPSRSAAEITGEITAEVISFRAVPDLEDDLTCLAIKIVPAATTGPPESAQRLILLGNTEELERLREWVANLWSRQERTSPTDDVVFSCQLAAQEAVTNIIFHGLLPELSQKIEVTGHLAGGAFQIELTYEGLPFVREHAQAPAFDGSRDHGFGLFLIDQLMDEVTYTSSTGNRNTIRLSKTLSQQ